MALPTQTADHSKSAPMPPTLAALGELLIWLNTPDNRVDWHAARLSRAMELVEAERAVAQAAYDHSGSATAEQIVLLRERVAAAKSRLDLAELVEEFTERTRLRIAATLRAGTGNADGAAIRTLAVKVNLGVRTVIADLTEESPLRPAETYRNARAALHDLTSGFAAVKATGAAGDLESWAAALKLTADAIQLAANQD
ncbi:hypothetical protein ACWEO1_20440 [Kitasatospora cineracea]